MSAIDDGVGKSEHAWQQEQIDALKAENERLKFDNQNLGAIVDDREELQQELAEMTAAFAEANQSAANLGAKLARAEALPGEWREYAEGLPRNHDNAVISRVRKGCAHELESALRDDGEVSRG